MFNNRGILHPQKIFLQLSDFSDSDTLFSSYLSFLREGGYFASGFDLSLASSLSVVFIIPRTMLKDIKSKVIEQFIHRLKDKVGSTGFFTGVFAAAESEKLRMFTLVSGLPTTDRLGSLLKQAREEGKRLTMKSSSKTPDFDVKEISRIKF